MPEQQPAAQPKTAGTDLTRDRHRAAERLIQVAALTLFLKSDRKRQHVYLGRCGATAQAVEDAIASLDTASRRLAELHARCKGTVHHG